MICFCGRRCRLSAGLGGGIAALWLVAAFPSAANADAAAGRQAYERGDYGQAMMDWQEAADHGDPDAEFGLGNLFEFGAGYLQQDYARAAYWYKKAAGHGNTEAEYRLALIFAAGGDNFVPNLDQAYKWASLATRSQGVWGTLAGDFKKLLDQVTSPEQQAVGEKLAAAWSDARAADATKDNIATAASPAAPSAAQPNRSGKSAETGCPGWPFPTLPCTEQFPALAGTPEPPPRTQPAPAQPAVVSPPPTPAEPAIDRLNEALARIDCAALRGSVSARGDAVISGTVADLAERARVSGLAVRLFPAGQPQLTLDIVPPPLCRSLAQLSAMRVSGLAAEEGLGLSLGNGGSQLREGDPITIEVRAPDYRVSLRLDYFALDGRVLHLTPDGTEPAPQLAAGATRLFGNPANGQDWRAGGAPFGTELITAIATAAPLDLGARQRVEPAADYLRALAAALDRARTGTATPNRIATLLVKTSGR